MENYNDIKNNGLEVAFIKNNRSINLKNKKAKIESINKYGIIVPIVYIKGEKAIKDGCKLVSIDGSDIDSTEAFKYIVLIDGQHRFKAALESDISASEIYMFECPSNKNANELLAEANIETNKWKSGDFVKGALLLKQDDELLQYINTLVDKGFPISTISKIVCFNKSLDSKVLSSIMQGKSTSEISYNLERAKAFIEVASKHFEYKFISKRYLIDAVIDLVVGENLQYTNIFNTIDKLNSEDCKNIQKCKGNINLIKESIKKLCV